jgi:hypothetical protein
MNEASEQLRQSVSEYLPKLKEISESDAATRHGDKWSPKEIIGHLIDSAVNNHQRFVRAQLVDPLVSPAYEQDAWVTVQKYQHRSWQDLLSFWEHYNRHLAHVIDAVPARRLHTQCIIGENAPVTLDFLMTDYVHHLRHHLEQIFAK